MFKILNIQISSNHARQNINTCVCACVFVFQHANENAFAVSFSLFKKNKSRFIFFHFFHYFFPDQSFVFYSFRLLHGSKDIYIIVLVAILKRLRLKKVIRNKA